MFAINKKSRKKRKNLISRKCPTMVNGQVHRT